MLVTPSILDELNIGYLYVQKKTHYFFKQKTDNKLNITLVDGQWVPDW